MQIACERCGTTYVLDEKVLPPAGAPVQCTRCSHVFTARPPGAAVPSSVPRVPMAGNTGTVAFGTPAADSGGVPRVPMSGNTGTVVFGTPATPEPGPSRSSTQMFGAPSMPPAAEPSRSSTQMFGAVKPAEQKPAERSSTQMFGAVKPAEQKPAERSSTQMFGAVKPAEQKPAERSSTQMFGAVKPAEQKPAERSSTQMFGAVGMEPPKPPEQQRSSTQMFGAVKAAEQKPAERSSTQMFGAVGVDAPKPPEQQRSSTQMFGAVGVDAPKPPEQRSSTQMFGAVKAAEAPKPPEQQRSSTQMFGAVGVDAPKPPEQERSSTQMFGAVGSDEPPAEQPPASRTVIFGNNPFDERVNPPKPPEPQRSSTQMFGAAETDEAPAEPDRQSRTMIFGNNPFDESKQAPPAPSAPPPAFEEEPSAAPRADQTLRFALNDIEAEAKRRAAPSAEPSKERPPTVEVSIDYGESAPAAAPPPAAKRPPETRVARPVAPVELPPENDAPPPAMPFAEAAEAEAESAEPATGNIKFYSDKPAKSRGGLVVAVIALALIAGAGYFVAKLWREKQQQIPGDAQARLLSAQTLLRADDRDSLSRASAEFSALATSLPRWQEPHAWNALAIALQLDEVNTELQRIADERLVLKQKIAKLEEAQDPADWQTRVNVMKETVTALDQKSAPALETAKGLEAQLEEWLKSAEPSSSLTVLDEASLLRAKMIASAARGVDPGQFVTAYQTSAQAPGGGWDVIAQGIYATRSKVAADWLADVTKSMESLRQSDTGFIRAHVVAARLQSAQGNTDGAVSALDTAVALNPAHQSAKALLETLQKPQ